METVAKADPEIGNTVIAAGWKTNYLVEGSGDPLILIHGSGPGVTGYANWRQSIPVFAQKYRVYAPCMIGFGFSEKRAGTQYNLDLWIEHLVGFMDALKIPKARFVGNSFGGGLTLAMAARHPERVEKFVLMGAAGMEFEVGAALELAWGYTPSVENMRALMDVFVYDKSFISDELVRTRYEASNRPGFAEAFSSLFPEPRQRHIKMLSTPEDMVRRIPHKALVIHGREDNLIPLSSSLRLHSLIEHSELHVFGECGHWTQIEKKDAFNALVMDFLSR
jgi:2-hydroxymuconate-semialdehyde hydrolase